MHGGRGRQPGFTLVELVMVIVLIGIIGVAVSSFMTGPIRAYVDQARRAALVDAADTSLRRIAREIRLALPNSVLVADSGRTLEFVRVISGGRYRDEPSASFPDPDDWLDFSQPDAAFTLTSPLIGLESLLPYASRSARLVIYNDGSPGADAYQAGSGVISPAGAQVTVVSDAGVARVALDAPHQFAHRSPSKRVFLVEGPVSILCNPTDGTLSVAHGYGWIRPPNRLSGTVSLLSEHVESCDFTYTPGATRRAGVVALELTLARDGERIRLFHQVQVVNAP